MIPKIFHAIWIGGNPLPTKWRHCWESWQHLHPHWKFILWTDETVPQFNFPQIDNRNDIRQRADVLRYLIIYLYGGVYVDVDFECLRPIDGLINGISFFSARENDEYPTISIGIFGAVPFHHSFLALISTVSESIVTNDCIGEQSGPAFFTRTINQSECKVFSERFFYPYTGTKAIAGIPFDKSGSTEAYAVHHWASITTVE